MVSFIVGMFTGIVISIPIGPINVAVVSKGLKQGLRNALATGLGASWMDFLYCAAAMLGFSALVHRLEVTVAFQAIGFIVLIYLGTRDLLTRVDSFRYENVSPKNGKFHSAFLVGVFMYLSNPTLVAFWITLSGIIQSSSTIVRNVGDGLLFAVGVGFGSTLWYYLLLKAILWKRTSFKAETLALLSKVSGLIMLSFGFYVGYQLLAGFMKHGGS